MAAVTPESVLIVDRRVFPRFEMCHYTGECYNGCGEKVIATYRVPENEYFVESGEDSPMIDDYKKPSSETD